MQTKRIKIINVYWFIAAKYKEIPKSFLTKNNNKRKQVLKKEQNIHVNVGFCIQLLLK